MNLSSLEVLIGLLLVLVFFFLLCIFFHWFLRYLFCTRKNHDENMVLLEERAHEDYVTYDCWCYYLVRLKHCKEVRFVYINTGAANTQTKEREGAKTKTTENEQVSDDPLCAICLERIKMDSTSTRLRCQHIFHKSCIRRWLMEKSEDCPCPLCHQRIEAKTVYIGDHHSRPAARHDWFTATPSVPGTMPVIML